MTTVLQVLDGRVVADDGTVVFEYDTLVEMARDGVSMEGITAFDGPEVRRYNRVAEHKIGTWEDTGEVEGPPLETYEWVTPEPYNSIDIWARLREACPDDSVYRDRLEQEIRLFEHHDMTGMVRHVSWMVGDFMQRKVLWGVGRGSSCASLVMYLVGLNLVDPVENDLPLEEFFKDLEPWAP